MGSDTAAQTSAREAAQQPEITVHASLRVERLAGVAEVVLTGPGKGNSMGPDFWREMPEIFTALDQDTAVRAVIVRGEGDHFSYGLDLPAMMSQPGLQVAGDNLAAERTAFLDQIGRMQQACSGVAQCRKPVIAAVAGWCIGGGLDLIAACDVRLCAADARFSLREVKLAIVADIGSLQRLPAIIGQGNTRELALTGKDIDAARALRMGLVNEVFESPPALLAAARAMARQIAANPPLVVQGTKRVLNESQGHTVEEGLRYVALWNAAFLQSHDLREAFAAFVERRTPDYQGR
ncbi:MAG TPA: crotonase/enoyl-CoA hydratase family protein [Ktedonobacterales bacterium]|jgi:enoyl-CoA hydratase|nr:crotonase/enoyl-CoA hydratase family protein [Ktedonobacterales bacterium]